MQDEIIYHHGIKGMKWGIRRFQNENGTLTPAGVKRYANDVKENLSDDTKKHFKRAAIATGSAIALKTVGTASFLALAASGHPLGAAAVAKTANLAITGAKVTALASAGMGVYSGVKDNKK